jgi:hypothetical protein
MMISLVHRELFVDGYDETGNRIYDKVNGMTCHQCRQKTLGRHTTCSECNSLHVRLLLSTPETLTLRTLTPFHYP